VKGLRDSQRLRESLNPTVKGIPTERLETTTSCGLNPTVKGIPTERPKTTISCGLAPNVKGHFTKSSKKSEDHDEHMFLIKECLYAKKYEVKVVNRVHNGFFQQEAKGL
jgi:hypothetical protein